MIQCPNPKCGGYKVTSETNYFNPRTGKDCRGANWVSDGAGAICVIVAIFAFAVAAGQWVYYFLGVDGLVAALLLFIVPRRRTAVRRTHYECRICGYRWTKLSTDPADPIPPTDSSGSNLMMMAKKLEEEEQQLAALIHEQERNRKK